mgnify:CR=1 FL=1
MKRTLPLCVLLSAVPTVALANPSLRPGHAIGSIVILLTAFVMEVTMTTGYLIFVGMSAGMVFAGLLVANFVTYTGVLLPLLDTGMPVVVIEVLVVTLEAVIIKVLAFFFLFQGDAFVTLRWRHAFIAAAIGNTFSYGVGRLLG